MESNQSSVPFREQWLDLSLIMMVWIITLWSPQPVLSEHDEHWYKAEENQCPKNYYLRCYGQAEGTSPLCRFSVPLHIKKINHVYKLNFGSSVQIYVLYAFIRSPVDRILIMCRFKENIIRIDEVRGKKTFPVTEDTLKCDDLSLQLYKGSCRNETIVAAYGGDVINSLMSIHVCIGKRRMHDLLQERLLQKPHSTQALVAAILTSMFFFCICVMCAYVQMPCVKHKPCVYNAYSITSLMPASTPTTVETVEHKAKVGHTIAEKCSPDVEKVADAKKSISASDEVEASASDHQKHLLYQIPE